MKTKITILAILLSVSNILSQEILESRNTLDKLQNSDALRTTGVWIPAKPIDNSIAGSTYLFPNWNGMFKVVLKTGESRQLFNLNYNIKRKTIESTVSKDSVFQYDIDKIDLVIQANKKYKVITDNELNGMFLEIYDSEKIKLYKEYFITVVEGVFNPMTQEKTEQDRFVQNFKYQLFINEKFEKVKLNKSDILNKLKDKKDEVKDFVSKNNLSFNSEEDISKILNFYNTLKQ